MKPNTKDEPREPLNVRYMTGWFLPEFKDTRKARDAARAYVAQRQRKGEDLL